MGMILELEQIQKYYGNEGNITKALGGISFAVEEGEFLGIMGASGSGKTTLLNCISTIDTVSAGHIYLYGQQIGESGQQAGETGKQTEGTGKQTEETGQQVGETGQQTEETGRQTGKIGKQTEETGQQTGKTGKQTEGTGQQAGETGIRTEKSQMSDGRTAQRIDITQMKAKELARFRRENLGFVFQDFNLLDTLTISENIALALAINKVPAGEVEGRVEEMCEKLNIGDILHKYPYQVSGGQKQRCACARALINHPKLLLADEPTGALDSHSARMLLSTMQQINEQLCATILMVTHDAFTASYASRILFLKDGAVFTELRKGDDERNTFFHKILNVLTMIGGGQSHVCETRV